MAADVTMVAAAAAPPLDSDHCQPIVSCDQMAAPKPRKMLRQQASDTRLARTCPAASAANPQSPALASRAAIPPRITSAVRARERGRSSISAIRSPANSSP